MGAFTRLQIQLFPYMFNRIQIRTLGKLLQNSPMFSSYPFLSAFSCVFWVVTLLEDPWPVTGTELSDTGQYVAPECLDSVEMSLCPAQIQGTLCQAQQSSPKT